MTAKEAREIWTKHMTTPDCNCSRAEKPSCEKASGYLECLYGSEVKALEEALERYGQHDFSCATDLNAQKPLGPCDCGFQKVLVQYHGAVKR